MQWSSHISSNVALKLFFNTSSFKRLRVVYFASFWDCKNADTSIGKGNFPFFKRFWDNNFLSKKVSLYPCGQIVKDGKVTLFGILETKKVVCPEKKSFNPLMVKIKNAKNRQKWISFFVRLNVFAIVQLFEQLDILKLK